MTDAILDEPMWPCRYANRTIDSNINEEKLGKSNTMRWTEMDMDMEMLHRLQTCKEIDGDTACR